PFRRYLSAVERNLLLPGHCETTCRPVGRFRSQTPARRRESVRPERIRRAARASTPSFLPPGLLPTRGLRVRPVGLQSCIALPTPAPAATPGAKSPSAPRPAPLETAPRGLRHPA